MGNRDNVRDVRRKSEFLQKIARRKLGVCNAHTKRKNITHNIRSKDGKKRIPGQLKGAGNFWQDRNKG